MELMEAPDPVDYLQWRRHVEGAARLDALWYGAAHVAKWGGDVDHVTGSSAFGAGHFDNGLMGPL